MEVLKKSQKISKRFPKDFPNRTVLEWAEDIYKFGPFRLDCRQRLLLRGDKPIPLTPKALAVLMILVQNAGCLITKEKLFSEVWPEVFVEEANLNVNIATLRKALGDDVSSHLYIETVPRLGYRFVAAVIKVADGSSRLLGTEQRGMDLVVLKESADGRDQIRN